MFRQRLIGQRIEISAGRALLDGGIEMHGIEGRKPGAQPRKLARCEPLNGFSISSAVVMKQI